MTKPHELREDDRASVGSDRPLDPGRPGPRLACEVAYYARAFVFGHYDSRGGATLVLSSHTATALRHYEQGMGFHPDRDAGHYDLLAGGRVRLVVCDRPLPGSAGELLDGYEGSDPGRLLARVESRLAPPGAATGVGPWTETDLAVLWVVPPGTPEEKRGGLRGAPEILGADDAGRRCEYRLRPWACGEDA